MNSRTLDGQFSVESKVDVHLSSFLRYGGVRGCESLDEIGTSIGTEVAVPGLSFQQHPRSSAPLLSSKNCSASASTTGLNGRPTGSRPVHLKILTRRS